MACPGPRAVTALLIKRAKNLTSTDVTLSSPYAIVNLIAAVLHHPPQVGCRFVLAVHFGVKVLQLSKNLEQRAVLAAEGKGPVQAKLLHMNKAASGACRKRSETRRGASETVGQNVLSDNTVV